MTNSPHVLLLRPAIRELERRGWDVVVTTRDFAQTIPLADRFGIPHTVIGRHRGGRLSAKALGMVARTVDMVKFGAGKGFDLAWSATSNDLPVAARILRIPHVTTFDYEFATLTHHINVRCSALALVPDSIPLESLRPFGGTPKKVRRFPGLKEEYYLADFVPDPAVVSDLGLDPEKIVVTVRTPPTMATYHRMANPLFDEVLRTIAENDRIQAVVLLRTPDQRASVEALGADNLHIPTTVVDAQSLIFYSDLVISGGGTVNREAAALGTPAYTIFKGTMGAVDRHLISEGRLRILTTPSDIRFEKKASGSTVLGQDISELVDRAESVARRA